MEEKCMKWTHSGVIGAKMSEEIFLILSREPHAAMPHAMVTPFVSAKIGHLPLFLEDVYADTAMSCQGFRSEPRTPSSMERTRTARKGWISS